MAFSLEQLKYQFKSVLQYVGDLITLISKDEEAWWRGNLNGNVGVFPSNYVEMVECKSHFWLTVAAASVVAVVLLLLVISVTRWLDFVLNLGHLQQCNFAQ